MSLIIWKRFALIAALTLIPPVLSGSGTVTRRPLPCVLLPTRSSVSKVLAQFMKLVVDQESTQLFMFVVVKVREASIIYFVQRLTPVSEMNKGRPSWSCVLSDRIRLDGCK